MVMALRKGGNHCIYKKENKQKNNFHTIRDGNAALALWVLESTTVF